MQPVAGHPQKYRQFTDLLKDSVRRRASSNTQFGIATLALLRESLDRHVVTNRKAKEEWKAFVAWVVPVA